MYEFIDFLWAPTEGAYSQVRGTELGFDGEVRFGSSGVVRASGLEFAKCRRKL